MSDFADHLYGEGLAERSVGEYQKWVRRAYDWCYRQRIDLDTISATDLRAWSETLPCSWSSRKQARTALRHYLEDYVGRDDLPTRAIVIPHKPRPKPRPLTPTDATTLRDTAIMVGGRQGLAVLCLLYTGARAGEAAALRWDGIGDETVRWWRTKRRDWHEVPLHPVLAAALDRHDGAREGHIFVGNNGRPHVSATTVWEWVRKVGSITGVEVNPKRLRATAGSTALEATGDIDAVAELLGHSDPATTRAYYTQTSARRLRAAVTALDY